jgi:hypothetical protein
MTDEKLIKANNLHDKIKSLETFIKEGNYYDGLRLTTKTQEQYIYDECKTFVMGYLQNRLDALKNEFNEL